MHRELVVDAPALRRGATPNHVDPARGKQLGEPLPFGGQKPGLLDVAAPVLDVVLGVRDVPVATNHGIAIGQRCHPVRERRHEPLLLELAVGAGLTGLDVDARDCQPVDVDLQHSGREARTRRHCQIPHRPDRMPLTLIVLTITGTDRSRPSCGTAGITFSVGQHDRARTDTPGFRRANAFAASVHDVAERVEKRCAADC